MKSYSMWGRRTFGAVVCGAALGLAMAPALLPCAAYASDDTRVVEDMLGNEVEVSVVLDNVFDGYPVNCGIVSMLGASDAMQYYPTATS